MTSANAVYAQFARGNPEACRVLVETHQKDLYNLCFRLTLSAPDAEDLFQATWVKALAAAGSLRHDGFRPWLFRICVNQYRDLCRHGLRTGRIFREDFSSAEVKELLMEEAATGESAESAFERLENRALLVSAVNGLAESHKIPLVLYYYQNLPYGDIARILGIPQGTVKSRLNTAKKILRERLEGEIHV